MLNDVVTAYAAEKGLKAFVVDAPTPSEYALQSRDGQPVYVNTNRVVRAATEPNGRRRIEAPFRLFGHVVCTQEGIGGIYWCLDLLRSGYVFAHVATSDQRREVVLPWQLTRSLLERLGWRRDRGERFGRRLRWGRNDGNHIDLRAALTRLSQYRTCTYQPQPGRILMFTATLDCGGMERDLVATVSGLVQRGYDIRVIRLAAPTPGVPTFDDELRKLGIVPQLLADFTVMPTNEDIGRASDIHSTADMTGVPGWFADLVSKAAAAIRHHRPAVVHGWLDTTGLVGALAATSAGVPRIVISFGSLPPPARNEQVPALLQPGYSAVAHNPNVTLLNNSAAGADGYERWLGLRRGSIAIVRNGFLRDHMRRPSADEVVRLRASLGLAPGQPLVGAVMRLSPEKDPALWLATAAEIVKVRPDVMFALCGYGPLRDETARLIEALGLGSHVRLPGPPRDLGLQYAAFDVVLLTSVVEGLPNMLIEAQAAGCPVVTTDVGGVREAVADGVTGIVVGERWAEKLAHAVLTILADRSWRQRAQVDGPAFVDQNFGIERMIDRTLEVYGIAAPPSADCHARPSLHAALTRLVQYRTCVYSPQPQRILMFTATLDCGGTERRMVATISGLVRRGYDIRVIRLATPTPGVPTFEDELRKLGIVPQLLAEFAVMPSGEDMGRSSDMHSTADTTAVPQWFADRVSEAAGAIRHHRPAIVHGWLDTTGLVGALAATSAGVPRVVITFGNLPPPDRNEQVPALLQPGYSALARNPSVTLLNNSAAGADGYERWLGLRRGSIPIVRNAFLRDHMSRPSADEVVRLRVNLGVAPGQPLVGAIMRLAAQKDPALWLATAAEIVKVRPDVVFALCGYGPLQDETVRLIEALGLRGHVRLPGPPRDLGLQYAAFDVVLLTSVVEGLPNMLIEAQAAGCPVVTTDVGGVREAVADGTTGIVVGERSAEKLAHAVLTILADRSWRQRAQAGGPAFVDQNFGLERMIDETIEVYGTKRPAAR